VSWKFFALAAVPISAAAVACYPTTFETTSQTDTVLTVEMPDVDYQANRTFVMTSTVFDLGDALGLECAESINEEFDPLIIETVRQNMVDLGYEEELDPETNPPDVGVFVGAVVCKGWVAYWYPGWGGWWGGYPPIYYPVPIVSSYRTGTLVFPIVELGEGFGDRDPEDPVTVQWFSAIDGLLSTSRNVNAQRIVENINQAFEQSPYLALGGSQP
jgi:hypothetical protein